MEDLAACIKVIVDIMSIEFTIWGFTMSLWGIMVSLLLTSIVIWLVGGYFNG